MTKLCRMCCVCLPLQPSDNKCFYCRAFNAAWQATLNAKLASEMEAEKAVKAKAAEEMSSWMAQRDIRLRAKKVSV